MPPKKAVKATSASGDDDKKFSWSAENDRKLLILTLGRTLSTDDYNKLVEAMPGTNYNGVRIRVSKFRVEQRRLFEELGWENSESTPAKPKTAGMPKKRKGRDDGDKDVEKTPGKKVKKEKGVKASDDGEAPLNDLGVKAEPNDEQA